METITRDDTVDFEKRLRRSFGRSGRTYAATAKVTKPEHDELETAAGDDGKTLSEWAREVLLREARTPRAGALFTEIVATRMLLNLVLKPIVCGEQLTAQAFSDVLTNVRTTKHKAAKDVMEQYVNTDQKEN
jgi:hypothetical protein